MTTLFYTKISRVSRVRAITDTSTGDEKRTGEVPTLQCLIVVASFTEIKTGYQGFESKCSISYACY